MSWGFVAVAGATLVGGAISADAQRSAGNKAADAQSAASEAGIEETRRQFDEVQKLLSPYVTAGTGSLTAQQNLIGLGGQSAQQQAVDAIQNSAAFQAQLKQGTTSILQNASATGGLRGGNTQAALAQFSPQLLAQAINDQYSKLGGITSLGQNAAAMTGNAGMQTGNSIASLLQQQGAAQAGAALSAGQAQAALGNSLSSGIGTYFGLGGGKLFGISGAKF